MVKPDIKRNYYADLELSSDATLEDIKKQYRRLALKYHPDRNPGKEAEIAPKFQIIQAAHEVLEDAATKAKYDSDRRKAGLMPAFGARAPAFGSASAPRPQHPYPASVPTWPPPPKRNPTATGAGATRPPPGAGADRFANFPKPGPAPTSKKDRADPTNVFTAWQNMNAGKAGASSASSNPPQPPRPQAKGAFGSTPQRPRPAAPPRQDTRFPTEEDIRAGTSYRQAPSGGFSSDKGRTQWAEFNAQYGAKPGMARSNTTKTPRKAGFDPMAGGDERQASGTANYSSSRARTRSDDSRQFPPPPPRAPPETSHPSSSHNSSGENDAPYTEGSRVKTPYSSHIGQQKYHSSDNLQRSNSARHAPQPATKPSPSAPKFNGTARRPFVVVSSSDDSDSDQESTVTTPDAAQPGNNKPPHPDFSADPFARPKRTPIPPSSRTASPFKQPSTESVAPTNFSGSNRADIGARQRKPSGAAPHAHQTQHPSQQPQPPQPTQKGKETMYGFFLNYSCDILPPQAPCKKRDSSATWSQFGAWAIPSSVFPSKRKISSQGPTKTNDKKNAPGIQGSTSTPEPWSSLSQQHHKKKHISPLSDYNAQRPRKSYTKESKRLYIARSPPAYHDRHAQTFSSKNEDMSDSPGFTFPLNTETFTANQNNAKSRSEETINTAFAADQWAGTFNANIFAAPPPASQKPHGPSKKSSRILRSQAHGTPAYNTAPSAGPFAQYTGGIPGDVPPPPPSPPPNPVKFNADEWVKTMKEPTWTFQPEAMRSDPAVASTSRSSSRGGRKVSAKAVKVPVTVPKPATATTVEDEMAQTRAGIAEADAALLAQQRGSGSSINDPMDVDMENVSNNDFSATHNQMMEPKFVKVDVSSLRPETSAPGQGKSTGPRLDDLASVLPTPSTGEGLEDLQNISTTLPFTSKSSATVASKSFTPQALNLPRLPVAPEEPVKLTKASWHGYCERFARYLAKYHDFDMQMVGHFRGRREQAETLISKGVAELESVGAESWMSYQRGIEEDKRVSAHWEIGRDKHLDSVRKFENVRGRVKMLSDGAGLADV